MGKPTILTVDDDPLVSAAITTPEMTTADEEAFASTQALKPDLAQFSVQRLRS
ncbi:MAG TPA: hypothetical protein VFY56_07550 [Propionibacteriaceae bacterium]|nr:hypothetical protein [Propionibacteriaceae bacterium]